MVCAAFGAAGALLLHPPAVAGQSLIPEYVSPTSGASMGPTSVEQVVAKVLPSVVTLQSSLGDEFEQGSGIILTPDGLIMTNSHVVTSGLDGGRDSTSTMVTFSDGRKAPFSVVATDRRSDVAVIRVQRISGLTPISSGTSADLRVGQPVVAVGSPLDLEGTVTTGIISALNRPVFTAGAADGEFAAFDAIQTDAALNPGSSGGPLFDMNGELIGMNSAMAALGTGGDSGDPQKGSIGIGFAIPIDHAKRIASELVAMGTASHGWLGAQLSNGADTKGATVVGVVTGSPAAAAGLSNGALVTRIDDQPTPDAESLTAIVQSKAPGTQVTMAFVDPSGDARTVTVTLGTDAGQG
ncbi:MAG TPA: trypsin-like peptidase domain-containing protein, partial [Mycobacterium sp.]